MTKDLVYLLARQASAAQVFGEAQMLAIRGLYRRGVGMRMTVAPLQRTQIDLKSFMQA